MPFNILDSVMNLITPNHIDNASQHLGESNAGITKAIGVGLPTILAGLISRVEKGEGSSVLNEAVQADKNPEYSNVSSLFGGTASGAGTSWLSSLFGSSHNTVTDSIGKYSGIKSSSATSVLGMLAPLVLSFLGRHASTNNLSSGSLSSLLTDHKDRVTSAMPSGFSVPGLLGLGSTKGAGDAYKTSKDLETVKPKSRLIPILIGLAAVLLLLYFLSRGCKNNDATNTAATSTDTESVAKTTLPAPVTDPERVSMKVKLTNGTELDAYKGGIEDQLVACLNDAACKSGKDKWFDFDNINFETGSANLTGDSKHQVSNIDMILKAYPKAKIKIGGYTDKTGDAAVNKKLSNDRAQTVAAALKADGSVAAQVKGAEGYGSEFAKQAATASDEERKSDRRISVQLAEK
ncbi:MAG TPA: OmpA family protein [Chitinophagaceae bacterium]|nr:OmpA family protein [Chitinophagaceae bacterium]